MANYFQRKKKIKFKKKTKTLQKIDLTISCDFYSFMDSLPLKTASLKKHPLIGIDS